MVFTMQLHFIQLELILFIIKEDEKKQFCVEVEKQGFRNASALSGALKAFFHSHSHFKLGGKASQQSSHFKLTGKAKLPSSHFKLAGTARQTASNVASQAASELASFKDSQIDRWPNS